MRWRRVGAHSERQTRLADAAHAGESDESPRRQQPFDLSLLAIPTDKARRWLARRLVLVIRGRLSSTNRLPSAPRDRFKGHSIFSGELERRGQTTNGRQVRAAARAALEVGDAAKTESGLLS